MYVNKLNLLSKNVHKIILTRILKTRNTVTISASPTRFYFLLGRNSNNKIISGKISRRALSFKRAGNRLGDVETRSNYARKQNEGSYEI